MSRLIDADALKKYATGGVTSVGLLTLAEIDAAPTIEAVPVVHGRWIKQHSSSVDSVELSKCSLCKYPVSTMWNRTNYCPNCGADMRGVSAND